MEEGRRRLLQALGVGGLCCFSANVFAADSPENPAIKNMLTRQSIRSYTFDSVSDSDLKTILQCAMQAPSAANEQPWEFVIFTDGNLLEQVGKINHYASYAKNAPLGILICLNTEKEKIKGMGILDIGMASQNILLAAHALGLGAVFTGIYPEEDRIKGFQELAGLPANVIPIGLIVIGKPEGAPAKALESRYQEANVHMQRWKKQ